MRLYMNNYLDTRKWTYLNEYVAQFNSTTQKTENFQISSGVNKPRHVFVFISKNANFDLQTVNPFLYNTFSVANDQTLESCHLEVGNGNEYPEKHYTPSTEPTRVFRDVMKYVHANSDYAGDTLLNRSNFETMFLFVHFDLTKQKADVRDGMTKLTFKYTLSAETKANYSIFAVILNEQDVEMKKMDGKLILYKNNVTKFSLIEYD